MKHRFLLTALLAASLIVPLGCSKDKKPSHQQPATTTSTVGPADFHNSETMLVSKPEGVMDTVTELTVVISNDADGKAAGEQAMKAAEETLRAIEKKMSSHLPKTDISRFNLAKAGQEVTMDPETIEVLKIARDYTKATDGVFDCTCRPLLVLWKRAGMSVPPRLPTDAEMKEAMSLVGWDKIKLTDTGATKLNDGVSLDLGGIAKKWGIDRTAAAMQKYKLIGGIVNVGGDLILFGRPPGGGNWQVGIRNPFNSEAGNIGTMSVPAGAVCSSGNYERFVMIDGKRYSHIVDARTGKTADAVPAVTAFGKTAVEAGIWGTALSVLGHEGFKLMPKDHGLEAMTIEGTPDNYRFCYTDGFKELLIELPLEPLPPTTEPATQPAETVDDGS